jgi:hypothetical protein
MDEPPTQLFLIELFLNGLKTLRSKCAFDMYNPPWTNLQKLIDHNIIEEQKLKPPSVTTLEVRPRTQGTFSAAVSERPYKRHQSEEPQQWNSNWLSDQAMYDPWSTTVKTEIGKRKKGGCCKCTTIHQKGEFCSSKNEPYGLLSPASAEKGKTTPGSNREVRMPGISARWGPAALALSSMGQWFPLDDLQKGG